MSLENRKELSRLRLEKAKDALSDAEMLLREGRNSASANRAY